MPSRVSVAVWPCKGAPASLVIAYALCSHQLAVLAVG